MTVDHVADSLKHNSFLYEPRNTFFGNHYVAYPHFVHYTSCSLTQTHVCLMAIICSYKQMNLSVVLLL